MARIVGGGGKNPVKSVGRPGFKGLVKTGLMTRAEQGVGRITPKSVTRLFKRDPAKRTALIGTGAEIGDAAQQWNLQANPNPTVVKKSSQMQTGTSDKGNRRRIRRQLATNYQNKRLRKS